MMLNIANPLKHKIEILGGFGEKLEMSSTGYNDYFNIIKLKNNKTILWGPQKITVIGTNKNRKINNFSVDKKNKIYSNMIG